MSETITVRREFAREMVSDVCWNAFHAGAKSHDEMWWAGGMADAEWLCRQLDLNPLTRYPAKEVERRIPTLVEMLIDVETAAALQPQ